MKRSLIPNLVTCLNLFSGCIGIVWALKGDLYWASWFIWLAAVLDFLDGFLARTLNAYSELGKQLDSLADMVSFGVLPATILYSMILLSTDNSYFAYTGYILAVFTAIRLAKFNLDQEQTFSFKGLPSPASAIFVSGLVHLKHIDIQEPFTLLIITLGLSLLMVSNLPIMALKFRNFSWKENQIRYLFLGISILLFIFLGLEAIVPSILLYLIISLIVRNMAHFKP
jgi:CDP-diacylglycerol--serine O-phosphatidyltransferase